VFSTSVASLAYTDAASKIALAVAVGLLVGLESHLFSVYSNQMFVSAISVS
jgi:hypothetical protein